MKRTTIMLPGDLKERASRRGRDLGISFGELVRESLALYLAPSRADAAARRDALFADDEAYAGPAPKDVSARHDDYLYGDKK